MHDLILSIGSGWADNQTREPEAKSFMPTWLDQMFATFLDTMNGEDAWRKFQRDHEIKTLERSCRLNIKFEGGTEPKLDDVSAIASMELAAQNYNFGKAKTSSSPFSPTFGSVKAGVLDCLADRIRGSLYFFVLSGISRRDDVAEIQGKICCRLLPGEAGFEELLARTACFYQGGKMFDARRLATDKPVRIDITFQHEEEDKPIRIDVNFGWSHSVTISGFPMMLKVSVE